MLTVHPQCLGFFLDESGHEEFADPNHPVYVLGGCAVIAADIEAVLRSPWRELKDRHFGGADRPLHASDVRNPTTEQVEALATFFRQQPFGRFAVAMTKNTILPSQTKPIEIMPGLLRRRYEQITARCSTPPVEVAFVHESSERGDPLLQKYFGDTVVQINGREVPVHHVLAPKGDETLEVADFIVHAVGGQARSGIEFGRPIRRDFAAIFHGNKLWSSFIAVNTAEFADQPPLR
jgi:hypothetical protein